MSADNYLWVRRREDGRFGVSHRFASVYYADEGHTVESLQQGYDVCEPGRYVVDEEWIAPAPEDRYGIFDTPGEAMLAAARAERDLEVVEYGICVGDGVAEE